MNPVIVDGITEIGGITYLIANTHPASFKERWSMWLLIYKITRDAKKELSFRTRFAVILLATRLNFFSRKCMACSYFRLSPEVPERLSS